MKRVVIVVVLTIVGYLGYRYVTNNQMPQILGNFSTESLSEASSFDTSSLFNVLGTTTTNLYEKATGALNTATNGKAEPIINKAVSDIEERIKNLPEEEYRRVKYEFCRDVMPSPVGEEQ